MGMRSGWCELCFYIESTGVAGGWTWEMRRRKVKGDHKIFGPINRVLPFIEIWKTRREQACEGVLSSIVDMLNLSCCMTSK